MSIDLIRRDLAAGAPPPLYLWHGGDRHAILAALALLRTHFLAADPSGGSIETFNGKTCSAEEVAAAARAGAFFSGRLVIVDDLLYFKKEKESGGKRTAAGTGKAKGTAGAAKTKGTAAGEGDDPLLACCCDPNPDNCLLLITADVNRGRRLYKEIEKNGKIVEFSQPRDDGAWAFWCGREAAARGKTINAAAARYLVDYAGRDTGLLAGELDKLALYSEGADIRPDWIRAVCTARPETTIFAMLDDWAAGKTGPALRKLDEVLGQDHYLSVFGMIVRHIRLLLAATLTRARGGDPGEFMAVAGVRNPFEGKKIFRQSARFTEARLVRLMENCLYTERALKSSGGDSRLLLETLLLR
ncbi:MAG: DNA polymerase III subunit delta [Gracilibacteraceae bacterium]|nr:DNA polymerase III subunit delta [Gracilibacteraceae bacterium]